MLTSQEIARKTIKEALANIGITEANEKSVKKSAYNITYLLSDGSGNVDEGTASCIVVHEWNPIITILFHNGANKTTLHKNVAIIKDKIIAELVSYEKNIPDGLYDFGTPIEWEEIEVTSNTAKLKIKLTVKANINKG